MRTSRILILVFCLSGSLFIVFRAITASRRAAATRYPTETTQPPRSVWGLFFYNTPFSLFPPNAAISLTDDNSTSFAARPAAFGPRLVPNGLSGQLWVGSGFAEDSLDDNGEFGCSDIPGWDGGSTRATIKQSLQAATSRLESPKFTRPKSSKEHASQGKRKPQANGKTKSKAAVNDGTDNHLHLGSSLTQRESSVSSSHADIQSIQEGAEIEGKIVLLMRGGCGFLEKVMWAQRRGAIAVVVGDNVKGGPLIQMFAHGEEVDNVTIPSVFTARTTAQLLSSLTQPGSFIEDSLDDGGNPVLKVQQGPKSTKKQQKRTPAKNTTPKKRQTTPKVKRAVTKKEADSKSTTWVPRIFRWRASPRSIDRESRPPSSGQLDWVLVHDWSDEGDKAITNSMAKSNKQGSRPKEDDDDFIIGVHDWRDPDLMDKTASSGKEFSEATNALKTTASSKDSRINDPKGGSITPSSGEYRLRQSIEAKKAAASEVEGDGQTTSSHGLMAKVFGDGEEDESRGEPPSSDDGDDDSNAPDRTDDPIQEPHEGLWVTITPTSSASPFFDTLLVLVISPLITLSIVYALLIIRARVRRRRWRAPKSVVERLPVRTYHTVARSPSLSPRLPSPTSTSPTTPLLQQSPTPSPPRSRPRSRTTTGAMDSLNFLAPASSNMPVPQPSVRNTRSEHEKGAGGFSAEWRKYMGRQVECVVCLEEYIDGVSRVMRLPCGHEFHADCITPWLTTRRRTCPICKGDVVRSLARGSWAGPRYEPYQDDGDDENEAEGSGSGSGSRSPDDEDLEQGIAGPSDARRQTWQDGLYGILSGGINSRRRERSRSPSPEEQRQ